MEKIKIPEGTTPKGAMVLFSLKKSTAYRAVKRGYFCKGYHVKEVCAAPLPEFFPANAVIGMSRAVFFRNFRDNPGAIQHFEDCVQEGAMRVLEMAGKIEAGKGKLYAYKLILNAQRNYLKKEGIWKNLKRRHLSLQGEGK